VEQLGHAEPVHEGGARLVGHPVHVLDPCVGVVDDRAERLRPDGQGQDPDGPA